MVLYNLDLYHMTNGDIIVVDAAAAISSVVHLPPLSPTTNQYCQNRLHFAGWSEAARESTPLPGQVERGLGKFVLP